MVVTTDGTYATPSVSFRSSDERADKLSRDSDEISSASLSKYPVVAEDDSEGSTAVV